MSIDTNALVKDFDELLFINLALALNGLSIFKEDKKQKELKNNLPKNIGINPLKVFMIQWIIVFLI